MARARNIKPAFFKNYDLADAGPVAQLLFAGLWCLADREGRLEDKPRLIKAELFPYYDCDVNGELTELERLKFVRRYTVGEVAVIEVLNFKKHQTPHNTEKASALPAYHGQKHLEAAPTVGNGELTVSPPLENDGKTPDSLTPDSLIPDSKNNPAARVSVSENPSRKKSAKFDPLTAKPENIGATAWADFCAHRHKKSALTEKACELIAKKLATHHDPEAVLYRSIENGWTGIFPEQVTHETSPGTRGTGRLSAVDAVRQAIAAREAAEAVTAVAGQAVAEDGGDLRPALDGEFRRVG